MRTTADDLTKCPYCRESVVLDYDKYRPANTAGIRQAFRIRCHRTRCSYETLYWSHPSNAWKEHEATWDDLNNFHEEPSDDHK